MNNTDCVCHGKEVGARCERRESGTWANWARYGSASVDRRHTQNGPEPRVTSGKQKWKRPTDSGWALNFGGEDEDRTHDLRIANAALSQLSYPPTV